MKALKALVIVMGVLIVAALTVVVVTVVQRAGAPDAGSAARQTGAPGPAVPIAGAPAPGFGETSVALPRGTRVVETRTAEGRIVLRVEDATGANQALIVIDAVTGRRLGLVRLQ